MLKIMDSDLLCLHIYTTFNALKISKKALFNLWIASAYMWTGTECHLSDAPHQYSLLTVFKLIDLAYHI